MSRPANWGIPTRCDCADLWGLAQLRKRALPGNRPGLSQAALDALPNPPPAHEEFYPPAKRIQSGVRFCRCRRPLCYARSDAKGLAAPLLAGTRSATASHNPFCTKDLRLIYSKGWDAARGVSAGGREGGRQSRLPAGVCGALVGHRRHSGKFSILSGNAFTSRRRGTDPSAGTEPDSQACAASVVKWANACVYTLSVAFAAFRLEIHLSTAFPLGSDRSDSRGWHHARSSF